MPTISIETKLFPTDPEGDLQYCNGAPGSHLVNWIRAGLTEHGYSCDELIQEDYGWGFWINQDGISIWNCVGLVDEPGEKEVQSGVPEWSISVDHEASIFNPKQFFKRKEGKSLADKIFAHVKDLLTSNQEIRIV